MVPVVPRLNPNSFYAGAKNMLKFVYIHNLYKKQGTQFKPAQHHHKNYERKGAFPLHMPYDAKLIRN